MDLILRTDYRWIFRKDLISWIWQKFTKVAKICLGNAQFVQNTTFGLWEKTIAQLRKNVPQITDEHTTIDCLRYVTLLICLRRRVAEE